MTELKETEKNLSKTELKLICETNFNGNYKEMLEKIEYGIKDAEKLNRTETAKFLKMDLETVKDIINQTRKHEIEAIVKFNNGIAVVLKKPLNFINTKVNSTIISKDDIFYSFLYRHKDPYDKAFGGRTFEVKLDNGTVEKCSGEWWDGITDTAKKLVDGKIISVTVKDIESLKKCYVFNGYYSTEKEFSEFVETYKGKVYEYYEYEKIIKGW